MKANGCMVKINDSTLLSLTYLDFSLYFIFLYAKVGTSFLYFKPFLSIH